MSLATQVARRDFLKLGVGGLGLSLPDYLGLQQQAQGADGSNAAAGPVVHRPVLLGRHEPSRDVGHQARCSRGVSRRVQAHRHGRARHPHRRTFAAAGPAHRQARHHSLDAPSLVGPRQGHVLEHHGPSAVRARKWPPICRRRARIGRAWGPWSSRFRTAPAGFPSAVQLPYPLVDNNTLQAGDNAGFLGQVADPIIIRPDRGRPWGGVSRDLGAMVLQRADGIDAPRLIARQNLTQLLDQRFVRAGQSPRSLSAHGLRHPHQPDRASRVQSRP